VDQDRNLFGDIDRLVEIEIENKRYSVPDQLEMLRVFQFLEFDIDYSRLCWNASCQRCFIDYQKNEKSFKALACRTKAFAGMKVKKLPSAIRQSDRKSNPDDEIG
jgi:hypothetical protein